MICFDCSCRPVCKPFLTIIEYDLEISKCPHAKINYSEKNESFQVSPIKPVRTNYPDFKKFNENQEFKPKINDGSVMTFEFCELCDIEEASTECSICGKNVCDDCILENNICKECSKE